jgi:hypothetical protein
MKEQTSIIDWIFLSISIILWCITLYSCDQLEWEHPSMIEYNHYMDSLMNEPDFEQKFLERIKKEEADTIIKGHIFYQYQN